MRVTVSPLNKDINVEAGSNLLESLLANDIPISYSCMSGQCNTCQCTLTSASNAGSKVLACMTQLETDCSIEIPEVDEIVTHPAKKLKGTVTSIEQQTHDIIKIKLKTNKPLEFTAGQYALLEFAPDAKRPYSMAGLDQDDELEFHIRIVPGGRVTPKLAETLRVGDIVKVAGPRGASYLRKANSDPILCIAGGTGFAPMLSVARGALEAGLQNDVFFYFGVRTIKDVYGIDILERLSNEYKNFSYKIVISESGDESSYAQGFVTDIVKDDFDTFADWRIYLAGPPPMVEAAQALVVEKNATLANVYADAFYATGD